MNILYSSVACSEKKYAQLFEISKEKPGQQVQKYHRLLMEGFIENEANVITVTIPPITRKTTNKKFFRKEKEFVKGIEYNYVGIINIPIIKHFTAFLFSFIEAVKILNKRKTDIVIGDVLNITVASATLFAAKIYRVKSLGIVTDVPGFLADNNTGEKNFIKGLISKFSLKFNKFIMRNFDSYIFMTEETNNIFNKSLKPYLVIEGQIDNNMKKIHNDLNRKYTNKVVMYTGSLKKIYGIQMLVEGFLKANITEGELHIYGAGNFESELTQLSKQHESIKYFGTVLNDTIVKEQLKASLLVNPRPTNEEYTKYSFPSKNMEYMASGTPTLTTKLPGLPVEYLPYLYLIDEESVDGISNKLNTIFAKPLLDLHKDGLTAKEFVMKNKNNYVQTKKILDFIEEI